MPVSRLRGLENEITPVQKVEDIWLKRDDLWQGEAPARGGKARTATCICRRARVLKIDELCAALDRNSSVPSMLARVCKHYRLKLRLWFPGVATNELPKLFQEANECGAALHDVSPGYMSVRKKRMWDYVEASEGHATALGTGLLWDGCGTSETAAQARNVAALYEGGLIKRVVVPVGSGGMLRGIANGLLNVPILGVCCGKPPEMELPRTVKLVEAKKKFHQSVKARVGDVVLDPVYEAKCVPFLESGDLLWIVAHRDTQ